MTVVVPETAPGPRPWFRAPTLQGAYVESLSAALAVAVAVGISVLVERVAELPNISMVFLLAVLLCAMRYGVRSAVLASLLSFVAYNFFFISPRYTLTVAQPHELLSLFIFVVVAVVTGSLAGRLHEQADATRERAEATEALYEFSRKLASAVGLDQVVTLLVGQCSITAKGKAVLLLKSADDLIIRGSAPHVEQLSTSDWAAARWANEKAEPAGRSTGTLPTAQFQFRPLMSSEGVLGALGISPDNEDDGLPQQLDAAIQAFIDQAAMAIERTNLVEEAQSAEKAAEAERLRNSLLSSVSHDLKTPLASIIGSASSLRELGDKMPKASREELLVTIEEEAQRLSTFVFELTRHDEARGWSNRHLQ